MSCDKERRCYDCREEYKTEYLPYIQEGTELVNGLRLCTVHRNQRKLNKPLFELTEEEARRLS